MKNWIFHALKVRIFGIRLQRLENRCLQKFPDKSYEKLTNISGMYTSTWAIAPNTPVIPQLLRYFLFIVHTGKAHEVVACQIA